MSRPPTTTVLVVEDEDSFVDALTVGLEREGFRVQVARDGAEALDVFDDVQPDLVLLDVMLPEGVGHRRVPRAAAPLDGADHHGHGQGRRDRHRRRASRSAPTTTSPSPTGCASWWPACGPCCGGRPSDDRRLHELERRRRSRSATCALDPERHEVVIRGEQVDLPLKEFELLALLLENAGRVLTRETADRPGVGRRLRRRHQDPRRPRQAPAVQGRGGPVATRPASSPSAAWATSTRCPGLMPARAPGQSAPARTMGVEVDPPAGGSRIRRPQRSGAGAAAPSCRPSPGWPGPTPHGGRRRPGRGRRWPGRCSSPSTRRRPAGKVALYLCSPSPRSRWPR